MNGYRDGYDFNKWYATSRRVPRRRPIAKWVLSALLVLLAGWIIQVILHPEDARFGGGAIAFIWLPMLAATMMSPFTRDTWLTDRGLASYDEFERTALTNATRRAYFVMLLGLTGGLLTMAASMMTGTAITLTGAMLVKLALAILGIGFCLPIAIAEWTVPMPDAEDEPL